jgi:hypothetical protein
MHSLSFVKIRHSETVEYFDFVISGQSLGQILNVKDSDLIGAFGWGRNWESENLRINEFMGLGKPELDSGRTCFYVCSQCGDVGCGAFTAKIEVIDNHVIWKNFGYENSLDLDDFPNIGSFIFDKNEYFEVFEKIRGK